MGGAVFRRWAALPTLWAALACSLAATVYDCVAPRGTPRALAVAFPGVAFAAGAQRGPATHGAALLAMCACLGYAGLAALVRRGVRRPAAVEAAALVRVDIPVDAVDVADIPVDAVDAVDIPVDAVDVVDIDGLVHTVVVVHAETDHGETAVQAPSAPALPPRGVAV